MESSTSPPHLSLLLFIKEQIELTKDGVEPSLNVRTGDLITSEGSFQQVGGLRNNPRAKAECLIMVEGKLSTVTKEPPSALLFIAHFCRLGVQNYKDHSFKGHQIINFFRMPWSGSAIIEKRV